MIANERQYRITKAAASRFAQALEAQDKATHLSPQAQRLMREAIESQLADLQAELADYEALRGGQASVLELHTLTELPDALIRARIAARLTQKQLAERLKLKEQQIQRYEATRYAGASLERLQAVADALGVQIQERIILPSA